MVDIQEVECGCCYELLVDPTTLTCGHSFCRYCLARWYDSVKRPECPECRQMWIGAPKTNVHLRTIIEKSFPNEIKFRKQSQEQSGDYDETVKKFNELSVKYGGHKRLPLPIEAHQLQAVFWLMVVVLVVVCALILLLALLYYLFLSGPPTSEVIFIKPVDKWTTAEVSAWIHGITFQLDDDYSERFIQARVDGSLLLSLTEEDLGSPPLSIDNILHRKMVAGEITKLKYNRVKKPKDLWDYKKAHRENSFFLLFMLQEYPRLTFMYLHYMEYDTIFRPLVQGIMGEACDGPHQNTSCLDETYNISTETLVKFYVRVLLVPYEIMARFAAKFIHGHFITMWIIISQCVMLTFVEMACLTRLREWRTVPRSTLKHIGRFILRCIFFWFLLTITPSFICDIVFYAKLYYGPVDTASGIRSGDYQTDFANKIKELLFQIIRIVAEILRPIFRAVRR